MRCRFTPPFDDVLVGMLYEGENYQADCSFFCFASSEALVVGSILAVLKISLVALAQTFRI